jgi:hypothetical protein
MAGLRKNFKSWKPSNGDQRQGTGMGALPAREQPHGAQQHAEIPGAQQGAGRAALDYPATDGELHGDGVLRLVLLAEKGLVELGEGALDDVGDAEEQGDAARSRGVDREGCREHGADRRAQEDAAEVLPAPEALVGGVLVHAPAGGMNTAQEADQGTGHRRCHGTVPH